jgi:ABC-type glycerol-3-phosphate transport system substrate-binding protein
MQPLSPRRWFATVLSVWAAAACLVGCSQEKRPVAADPAAPRREYPVRLIVVDDPDLAAAVDQLGSEWQARTGARLEIAQLTGDELSRSTELAPAPDAIIYPAGLVGTLAQRGWIAPLPADFAKSGELDWSDTFDLLQVAETMWGTSVYAVPFGSPVLTCYYRSDLFEKHRKRPPQDWSEYQELSRFFAQRDHLGELAPPADVPWYGALEPRGPGWGGLVLLARAAAYAKHRDHYSALFKIDSMEPLIAGEPFRQALEEMVAAAKIGPPGQPLDADRVRHEFLSGHAAMALTIPGHAGVQQRDVDAPQVETGFAELPGSRKVYNLAGKVWENRLTEESNRVTMLGIGGRLGSLGTRGREASNALPLLAWLAGRQWGATVSSASPATALFRRSQVRTAQPWLDPRTDAGAARQYGEMIEQALGRQSYLAAPRIAGRREYLAALDRAVEQAISGAQSPAAALTEAAESWKRITAELGREAQQRAYRQSLLLEP